MKKVKHPAQSILVPKSIYKTLEAAKLHVKSLGYDPDFKQPYETPNFYRFRQYDPPKTGTFRSQNLKPIGGNPNTWTPQQNKAPIGGNPNTWTPK